MNYFYLDQFNHKGVFIRRRLRARQRCSRNHQRGPLCLTGLSPVNNNINTADHHFTQGMRGIAALCIVGQSRVKLELVVDQ